MKNDLSEQQGPIEYPCIWLYKLIGLNRNDLERAIHEIIQGREFQLDVSNTSSGGKYISLNLELEVGSENERNGLYLELKNHPAVKIVL